MATTENTEPINTLISLNLKNEILMTQVNLKIKGEKIDLKDMYPEIMELGLAAYKRKKKLK